MTALTLPASLSAALSSLRWPLGASSCPPLHFESLDGMKSIREKTFHSTPLDTILLDLPASLENLFPSNDKDTRHFGVVSVALLCLGHGLTDEAHDLVTPLSWPEDTHFGFGPSIASKISPTSQAYATYVHCLVHRREAFNVGEFGMAGFANANYWSNAVLKSPGVNSLPHADLLLEIRQLAQQSSESIPGVREWSHDHGLFAQSKDPFFESRAVHELCANVLRGRTAPEMQTFAERVAETELRVLLAHALQKAGYDCDLSLLLRKGDDSVVNDATIMTESNNLDQTAPSIDENVALSAARRVSSAHLNMFQSGGSVIIRSVLDESSHDSQSAAAGIACRLLESPACRFVSSVGSSQGDASIRILLPGTAEEAKATLQSASGDNISQGDVYAARQTDCDCSDGPWYSFVACDASDNLACFVDRFFGTRGETPTSVIQWSKGTIF